jgi:hypothetical protein
MTLFGGYRFCRSVAGAAEIGGRRWGGLSAQGVARRRGSSGGFMFSGKCARVCLARLEWQCRWPPVAGSVRQWRPEAAHGVHLAREGREREKRLGR